MSASTLNTLNRQDLRELAGDRSFARGEAYFNEGRVRSLTEYQGELTATVSGTHNYRVKLWAEEDYIDYSCSCPVGSDDEFCKHCVAVGLAWLTEAGRGKGKRGKAKKSAATMDDVRTFLERQDKSKLVEMIMHEAMENDRLREQLFLETARMNPDHLDLATYRRAIKNATRTNDFVDYYEAGGYAQGIYRVIGSIAALLNDNHAAEVIDLTEYALSRVEDALGHIDDSDGRMGGILHELQELHHRACQEAKPDPELLARRLFKWETESAWETFYGAAETYRDVLGQKGLAEYRRLAEAEWARVPVLGPGEDDSERYGKRFRITSMMETLARQKGDVEALVEIKRRDLSHAYSYLQIAEVYREAGKHDQALEWAERGMQAFTKTDWRLSDFLADEYHRRGRHDEAMNLIWAQFAESPRLDNYQKLHAHARQTGRPSEWSGWRGKALAYIRKLIEQEKKQMQRSKNRWPWQRQADHSLLVRVFLWEKRYEDAWREACAGGCSDDLWLELAAGREKEHPEDALSVYRQRIAPTIEMTSNSAYQQAIELLRKVRKLMLRLGRAAEFDDYVVALRVDYKRKRNFIKLLDEVR